MPSHPVRTLLLLATTLCLSAVALAAPKPGEGLVYPPALPGGVPVVSGGGSNLLAVPPGVMLRDGVAVAQTAPAVAFAFYPGQDKPDFWSNWGDGLAVTGAYYSSIGNHKGLAGRCMVYAWDDASKTLRMICDVNRLLNLPTNHYTPGKIHGRLDMGGDGWLYFATARGSTGVTTPKNHYEGDWILRANPANGQSEVVTRGPAGLSTIFATVVDAERMLLYGGTTAADNSNVIGFFAYDLNARKRLFSSAGDGCYKYFMFARSTGRVYYIGHKSGCLYRYDPATPDKAPLIVAGQPGGVVKAGAAFGGDPSQDGVPGMRSATRETAAGFIYTISNPEEGPSIWRFNTKTEKAEKIGVAAIASQTYVTSIDADPSGRYLYYIPGAHGGAENDGAPLVQYDTVVRRPKVIAFLGPWCERMAGFRPRGSFGCAVSPGGDKVYVTWHGTRNLAGPGKTLDTCALTVVTVPADERKP
jgi:hypothetical protein